MLPDPTRPEAIRRLFAGIAPRYDLVNRLISLGRVGRWRERALKALEVRPEHLLLDACAGTGELGRRSRAGRVVAVDFSLPMLQAGARHRDRRLWLVCGDALRLPLADGCCDRAIVGFSLRNVADVPRFFREAARVVRPGGRLVSLELTRPPGRVRSAVHCFCVRRLVPLAGFPGQVGAYRHLAQTVLTFPPPEEVAEWMREAGWREVSVIPLSGGICTLHVGER